MKNKANMKLVSRNSTNLRLIVHYYHNFEILDQALLRSYN